MPKVPKKIPKVSNPYAHCSRCIRFRSNPNLRVSAAARRAAQKGTACCQECRKGRGTRRKRSAGRKPYPVGGTNKKYYGGVIRLR